jgi:hypothetical protein
MGARKIGSCEMKSLFDIGCRQELRGRVQRVGPDTPHLWGKMTAPQMICHLNDAFLGVMGEKPMEIPRGFTMWPVLKYAALYAPAKWPQGVPTRPEFDQCSGAGTPPAQFESDVSGLLETMDRFWRSPRDFQFRPHPLFKTMSEAQWMRWGYLHVDHHLRQFGQ